MPAYNVFRFCKVYLLMKWQLRRWTRLDGKWAEMLQVIECDYLKVKIAALVFWDVTNDRAMEWRVDTPFYLRELSRCYKPEYEKFYTEADVERELRRLHYTLKEARKRSRIPKNHRGQCV